MSEVQIQKRQRIRYSIFLHPLATSPFSLLTSPTPPAPHQQCLHSESQISLVPWMASSCGPIPKSVKLHARLTSGMRGLSFYFPLVCTCTFRLTLVTIFSYNMLPRDKFGEFVRSEFGLLVGMAYPDTDTTRLRVTSDYMSILFTYDDLMDLSTSELMHDRMGADKAAKVMMSVLTEPLHKFRPVPGLPVATAFHEYVMLLIIAFDITLTSVAVSGCASALHRLVPCKRDLPRRPVSTCSLLATRSAIVSARSAPRSRSTSP